jgi:hypothetical protein
MPDFVMPNNTDLLARSTAKAADQWGAVLNLVQRDFRMCAPVIYIAPNEHATLQDFLTESHGFAGSQCLPLRLFSETWLIACHCC